MANCERCGLQLPDGAEYCPNCGTPVMKRHEASTSIAAPAAKLLEAGLLGAFIAVMIGLFVPPDINLYFLPSFIGAFAAVFLFRTRSLGEAITIALAVFFFTDAIINVMNILSLYFSNMSWIDLAGQYPALYNELYQVPTSTDVLMYIANPISAIVAAYLGYDLTAKPHTKQPAPYSYERRNEQGGIVYSVDSEERKPSAHFPHKV
jgi:hypothetical protein